MLIIYILTGVVIGTALFAGIFYLGYKTGKAVYEEL